MDNIDLSFTFGSYYSVKLESIEGNKAIKSEDLEPEHKYAYMRNIHYNEPKYAMIEAIRWNYKQHGNILTDEDDRTYSYTFEGKKIIQLEYHTFEEVKQIHDHILTKIYRKADRNCGLLWFARAKNIRED